MKPDRLAESGMRAREDHSAVRLWLRLLGCSTRIEQEIRRRLRAEFSITLGRFDFLAQLERHPQGLRMSELSRRLMVTGGNVTGLTDQLAEEGWVMRKPDPEDRRSWILVLTKTGRQRFLAMAQRHEDWLVELLQGFDEAKCESLHQLLGRLRVHLDGQQGNDGAGEGGGDGRRTTSRAVRQRTNTRSST